jgi:hypothetical protein
MLASSLEFFELYPHASMLYTPRRKTSTRWEVSVSMEVVGLDTDVIGICRDRLKGERRRSLDWSSRERVQYSGQTGYGPTSRLSSTSEWT